MKIENCQIRGRVSQRFILLNEKPPDGYTWSGGRLTRKQTNSRPDNVGQMCGNICLMHQNAKKSKSGLSGNQSSIMPEDHVVSFIEPEDEDFQDIMKNARKKLEIPMPAAMPCKTRGREYRDTCSAPGICTTKYACIVEADVSTLKRLEGTLQEDHEDHIAGQGINSLNLVHKFIPMFEAMKKNRSKSSSG